MSDCKQQLLDNVLSVVEDIEQGGDPWNLLGRALDIEYTVNSKGKYVGSTICMATGGPHIEIDTRYDKVIGYWGTDKIERHYNDNIDLYAYMGQLAAQLIISEV